MVGQKKKPNRKNPKPKQPPKS
ncbi:uncharacterized protein G2W53_024328 [Senna tora]|uniref:Uncharacterized protein n=1 Tax=Senna tora TaxID=362788 RepID=A0A834TB69_9FABA|nr:uncharacterized protein G2W53_024328 [Senna tora]